MGAGSYGRRDDMTWSQAEAIKIGQVNLFQRDQRVQSTVFKHGPRTALIASVGNLLEDKSSGPPQPC
jgi:hypothetical protein